ncbi:riboflavin biosynthesis protein RibD, partial [Roseomonas sp. DSM 102946]|nr:riboflavin biosynthesis protein RibD [Roseomonas sp. DSM 102946]
MPHDNDIPATEIDRQHMRVALALAARGLGNTWPNPAVGCVIVHDGVVVGRG